MKSLKAFALILFIALGACTQQHTHRPKSDAEGFLGLTKLYIHAESSSKATIIEVKDYQIAWKWGYEATKDVANLGEVPLHQIIFSGDKKFLTLVGDSSIFASVDFVMGEINPVTLAQVPKNLETHCLPFPASGSIGTGGFEELQIKSTDSGGLNLFGWKGDALHDLGPVTKEIFPFETKYVNATFGEIKIDLTQPLDSDSFYYKSNIPTNGATIIRGIFCHQSRRAIHQVFTTSNSYSGNLGGLTGADSLCQGAATAAGLSGNWKAILGDSTSSAQSRLVVAGPVSVVGSSAIVATDAATLWDGNLDVPINRNEFGALVPAGAQTWTQPIAVLQPQNACTDWTSNAASLEADVGLSSSVDSNWFSAFSIVISPNCSDGNSLYCISQP